MHGLTLSPSKTERVQHSLGKVSAINEVKVHRRRWVLLKHVRDQSRSSFYPWPQQERTVHSGSLRHRALCWHSAEKGLPQETAPSLHLAFPAWGGTWSYIWPRVSSSC